MVFKYIYIYQTCVVLELMIEIAWVILYQVWNPVELYNFFTNYGSEMKSTVFLYQSSEFPFHEWSLEFPFHKMKMEVNNLSKLKIPLHNYLVHQLIQNFH